jgi:hypothetical protein
MRAQTQQALLRPRRRRQQAERQLGTPLLERQRGDTAERRTLSGRVLRPRAHHLHGDVELGSPKRQLEPRRVGVSVRAARQEAVQHGLGVRVMPQPRQQGGVRQCARRRASRHLFGLDERSQRSLLAALPFRPARTREVQLERARKAHERVVQHAPGALPLPRVGERLRVTRPQPRVVRRAGACQGELAGGLRRLPGGQGELTPQVVLVLVGRDVGARAHHALLRGAGDVRRAGCAAQRAHSPQDCSGTQDGVLLARHGTPLARRRRSTRAPLGGTSTVCVCETWPAADTCTR